MSVDELSEFVGEMGKVVARVLASGAWECLTARFGKDGLWVLQLFAYMLK